MTDDAPSLIRSQGTGVAPSIRSKKFYDGQFMSVKSFDASQKIESTVIGMGTEEIEEYSGIKSEKGLSPGKLVKIFEQKNNGPFQ